MAQQFDNTKNLKANVLDEEQHHNKGLCIFGLVLGLWGPFVAATIVLFYLCKVAWPIASWIQPAFEYLLKG